MPCNDVPETADNSEVVSVIDIDGEHDQNGELCSPFCQCHCCHVHTIDFGLLEFEPLQLSINKEYFQHFDGLDKGISDSLLQPPQV